jgi:hypothetical protein
LPEDNLEEKEHDRFLLDVLADKVQVVNKAGSYLLKKFKKKNQ